MSVLIISIKPNKFNIFLKRKASRKSNKLDKDEPENSIHPSPFTIQTVKIYIFCVSFLEMEILIYSQLPI
jgi:hypothetical protein